MSLHLKQVRGELPNTFVYLGTHNGPQKVMDFEVTVIWAGNSERKFEVTDISFGSDVMGETVEDALECLVSRMKRACEVLEKVKASRSIPVAFEEKT